MASSVATRGMFVAGAWSAGRERRDVHRRVAGDGRADRRGARRASRADAQRAIAAANDAATGWARLTAFERAALMHRVGDEIEKRRDELAHVLTLDQGKPLHESRDEVEELVAYWRNAAEDGKRLEGRLANSFTPGKRVLLVRRPRGVIGVITPWNWPYTMPAELIAPALASRQHGRLDARVDDGRVRDAARRVRRRSRPAGRRLQLRHRAGLGRRRRDRAQSRARTASASSARPRPAARSPRRPPARRRCSSSAATGRSS